MKAIDWEKDAVYSKDFYNKSKGYTYSEALRKCGKVDDSIYGPCYEHAEPYPNPRGEGYIVVARARRK